MWRGIPAHSLEMVMLDNRFFWGLSRAMVAVVWGILLIFGFIFPSQVSETVKILAFLLLAIHVMEVPISLKIGVERGTSKEVTITKTLIYGCTWWMPLKRGVIDE